MTRIRGWYSIGGAYDVRSAATHLKASCHCSCMKNKELNFMHPSDFLLSTFFINFLLSTLFMLNWVRNKIFKNNMLAWYHNWKQDLYKVYEGEVKDQLKY